MLSALIRLSFKICCSRFTRDVLVLDRVKKWERAECDRVQWASTEPELLDSVFLGVTNVKHAHRGAAM